MRCQDSKVCLWTSRCFRSALHSYTFLSIHTNLLWWLQGADMMDEECLSHATRSDGGQGQLNPLIPDPSKLGLLSPSLTESFPSNDTR